MYERHVGLPTMEQYSVLVMISPMSGPYLAGVQCDLAPLHALRP